MKNSMVAWLFLIAGITAASLALGGVGNASPSPPEVGSQAELVGSWRLESWTNGGVPRCGEEEGSPSGQITYSADGHMSAQLGCAELSLDGYAELTAEQAVARWRRRHFSYYGTYTVDAAAQTVTHHVLGSVAPQWVGTDRVRNFVFEGSDRIVLTPVESAGRLVWVRN